MKRAIIGSKSRIYGFEWFDSNNKKDLNADIKSLKNSDCSFSLTVKSVFGKKTSYITAGINSKEDKEDLKTEGSAGALSLMAFAKSMKKSESINFSGHTIKESKHENERAFSVGNDVTSKNWILMFTADDQDSSESGYWIAVIKNGVPWLQEFDQFVSDSESYVKQSDIIDYISNDVITTEDKIKDFTFVSDSPDIIRRFEDIYFNNDMLTDKSFESIVISFDNLIEGVKQPSLKVINTSVINPLYIGIVLAIAGIGFGVNYYLDHLKEQEELRQSIQDSKNKEKTTAENLKMQEEYEKLKEKTLQDTLKEANKELNDKISEGNPDLTINAWLNEIYGLKLDYNGWLLRELNCAIVSSKVNCSISLDKGQMAFNKDIMINNPLIQIAGNKGTFGIKSVDEIEYRKENYNTLPNSKYFLIETVTLLQKLELAQVKYATGELQEITKSVTLPEPPNKIIVQKMDVDPIKMGVSAGTLKINGSGLYKLEGLKTWLSDPTLKLEKLKVTVSANGDTNWEIDGNYFIKTAEAPTLPTIEPSTIGGVSINK